MRIIITGAKGFIGSVLAKRASEIGHDVLALDDMSRGLNTIEKATFSSVPGAGSLSFQKHDCQGGLLEAVREKWWSAPVANTHLDAVVHLAAGTGSLDRPIEELRALNVEMTKRVYMDAKTLGAKVFAFPTTSLGTVPSLKDAPYVLSKEEAFEWLKVQTDPRPLPFRFFNVAGSYKGYTELRRREVHLIPALAACVRVGGMLTVNGNNYDTHDGTPARDFVNVLDVADAILNVLANPVMLHRPQPDGAMWFGTGWTVTTRDAVTIVDQWFGPVQYPTGPRRAFDTGFLRCPDNAAHHFAQALGRSPAPAWVSIRDEIRTLLVNPTRP